MLQKAVMTRLRGGRMEKSISAADACRKFSQVLRDVRKGQTYVITSHGKSVARFAPFKDNRSTGDRARASLLSRLRAERVVKIGRPKRDETMVRAFNLLAGLPNNSQPSGFENDRPRKRKRVLATGNSYADRKH